MPGYPRDHAELEVLPFDLCLRLLSTVPVGRVSFFAGGEIVVLLVNFVMDGQDPAFRTTHGSKLSAAEDQEVVAFEADSYDERGRSGWSVLVNGRAETVDDDAEIRRLDGLGLKPWPTAVDRPFWIRIRPESVTGRRTPWTELRRRGSRAWDQGPAPAGLSALRSFPLLGARLNRQVTTSRGEGHEFTRSLPELVYLYDL